jgi:hypothetical protein
LQAKADLGRELHKFTRESEDIIKNFEGFEELLERRLTEFLRNDLTESLESYLGWMKKRADKYPLENETDKTMCVCFIKEKKGYHIYPMLRAALPKNLPHIVLLYDEFERIVKGIIDGVRDGKWDLYLRWDIERLLYFFAKFHIKIKEDEAGLKNV